MKIFILLQKLSTLNSQLSTFFATFALEKWLESAKYARFTPLLTLREKRKIWKRKI